MISEKFKVIDKITRISLEDIRSRYDIEEMSQRVIKSIPGSIRDSHEFMNTDSIMNMLQVHDNRSDYFLDDWGKVRRGYDLNDSIDFFNLWIETLLDFLKRLDDLTYESSKRMMLETQQFKLFGKKQSLRTHVNYLIKGCRLHRIMHGEVVTEKEALGYVLVYIHNEIRKFQRDVCTIGEDNE